MHFTRLRLSGFKSFVDPSEVHIDPGLTGIVGPNGCGKSNVVEALRWVMGETAPTQMRGSEMDDVIFAGASDRPPRNIAEVLLSIDNSDRSAPAAYNEGAEIDVSRRIERGGGSLFRVNGRDVRARDVQTLFADTSTGARSTAIVSQGRIGEMINARPAERRRVLEEAAGITGLHARRHEAELRLRAAETNLERLDDVIGALEERRRALKRQARQASRYRNLSDHIRRAEAMLLHRRWDEATDALASARAGLAQAEEAVAGTAGLVARATAEQEDCAATLPGLRGKEAESAAALQRLLAAREAIDAENRRIGEAQAALAGRLEQLDGDLARERTRRSDAEQALKRLESEQTELNGLEDNAAAAAETLAERLAESDKTAAAAEEDHAESVRVLAGIDSRRGELDRRLQALDAQRLRQRARREDLLRAQADQVSPADLETAFATAESATAAAAGRLEAAQNRLVEAEAARAAAEDEDGAARESLRTAGTDVDRAEAEIAALAALLDAGLDAGEPGLWPPMIDMVKVTPGYEITLGAALGDDLLAPGDDAAPVHWHDLGPDIEAPPLPAGTRALSEVVSAPPALQRRLAQIGLVEDEAAAQPLAGRLVQGQRLVARSGALWRWDGYRIAAGAPTTAATRMAQRNRLGGLRAASSRLEAAQAAAGARARTTGQALGDTVAADQAARNALREAEAALSAARSAESDRRSRLASARAQRRSNDEALAAATTEMAETEIQFSGAEGERAALPDQAAATEALAAARSRLAALREDAATVRQDYQRHVAEAGARRQRIAAIDAETGSWRGRAADAARHAGDLDSRRQAALAERESLAARPAGLAAGRASLDDEIGAAEADRDRAAGVLADAESRVGQSARALRAAEAQLADDREERVRREAAASQADLAVRAVAERVRERLGGAPEDALAAAGLDETAEIPDTAALETRLERSLREREIMGPVNLRAEAEAAELDARIATMHEEREDLIGAIARLRQGIAGLNREGRGRLIGAFETVDGHFRAIFTRLFGGGNARLALTEAEDPFECGLEVMASPPGKRLQTMSLMSGGERALSAISLLFAVFLTNPAPICVLDEVDAALDDHNVDRFCDLLNEISGNTETRFLVITHHRVTMARMDRLYGVTMPENGVSQLVSVDLRTAERLRGSA